MVALPIYGGPLKGDIVRRAYGLCGQSATVFDLDPEDMYTGLLALDDSMAMLGPLSGYNAPYSGVSSSEDESGIAAGDVMGVTVMTARVLAPAIGKTLALSAIQARAESGLLAKCNPPPQMGLGRNTIAGAGNRYYRWWGPFLPTALDTVSANAATTVTAALPPVITSVPTPAPSPSGSPTPTPTPTPTTIPTPTPAGAVAKPGTPTIARSGTPGTAPLTWTSTDDRGGIFDGDYWDVERYSDAALTNLTGQAIQMIQGVDLEDGADTLFPALGSTPVGTSYIRERVLRDDGMGGFVNGDWSNVISDTIAPTFNATWNSAKVSTVSGAPAITLSADKLTETGVDPGYQNVQSIVGTTKLSAATAYIECKFSAYGRGSGSKFGFVNTAYVPPVNGAAGQIGDATSTLAIDTFGFFWKAGNRYGGFNNNQYNTVVGLLIHRDSGKVWVRTDSGNGWANGTPAFNADGSLASTATGGEATGFTDIFFAAGDYGGGGCSINASGTGLQLGALPANVNPGWA